MAHFSSTCALAGPIPAAGTQKGRDGSYPSRPCLPRLRRIQLFSLALAAARSALAALHPSETCVSWASRQAAHGALGALDVGAELLHVGGAGCAYLLSCLRGCRLRGSAPLRKRGHGQNCQRERDAVNLRDTCSRSPGFLWACRVIPALGSTAISNPTPEWNVRSALTRRSWRRRRERGIYAAAPTRVSSKMRRGPASCRSSPTSCLSARQLLQAFDADRRRTLEVGDRLVDHLDPAMDAQSPSGPSAECIRPPDEVAGGEPIRLAVAYTTTRLRSSTSAPCTCRRIALKRPSLAADRAMMSSVPAQERDIACSRARPRRPDRAWDPEAVRADPGAPARRTP